MHLNGIGQFTQPQGLLQFPHLRQAGTTASPAELLRRQMLGRYGVESQRHVGLRDTRAHQRFDDPSHRCARK